MLLLLLLFIRDICLSSFIKIGQFLFKKCYKNILTYFFPGKWCTCFSSCRKLLKTQKIKSKRGECNIQKK